MKQTAVDWLIEKVNGQSTGLGMYGMNVRIDIPADIIQQAKEIEKEQMCDFAFKYGDLTTREIADSFDKEYKTNEK